MAVKYTSDPTYTNPYGIGAQEQNVALSQKLIAERKANEAQLIAEQAKYSRVEQKRLEAEAVAAAARGDPTAAAKQAAATQYANERASVAADLERNGRLLQETEIGLQENQAVLARMQATQAATPPNVRIVNAGTDPAANNPPAPATPTLNETTPASSRPAPGADPFSVTPRTVGPATPAAEPVPQGNSPYASQRTQQIEDIQAATPEPPDQTDAETARLARQEQVLVDAPAPSNSPYASQRAQQNEQIVAVAEAAPPDQTDAETARLARQEQVLADAPAPSNSPYASQRAQQNEQIAAANPEPQDDPYADQSAAETARLNRGEASAEEAASNESTAETARLNRGEDAAVEASVKQKAQEQQALQARFNTPANGDWRVRIRLAPNSNYLYNSANPGILAPLKASDGVIFPYTPAISTSYNAEYDVQDLTHSNYRGQFYKSSNTGDISINGTFTAQDTLEAEYMLAVIHFFRSVTKMFYGQDAERGAPPPLVYLFGLGQYQFNNHPCLVKSFNYSLPTDVDYIRTQPNNYGQNLLNRRVKSVSSPSNGIASVVSRLSNAVDKLGNFLKPGALPGLGSSPAGQPGVSQQAVNNTSNATYVPTKIEIQISLLPIQTRNQVSQQFSLKGYANGDLLRGGFW